MMKTKSLFGKNYIWQAVTYSAGHDCGCGVPCNMDAVYLY